jgi:hypothetical protein
MPDTRTLAGVEPSDLRFQFKIIEGLSESIRQQSASTERLASGMADMQRTQVGMLERLAKLEANRVAEVVAEIRLDVASLEGKVSALMTEKAQRQGAYAVFGWLRVWGPVIFSLFAALWLFGRSLGIVPAPPAAVPVHAARGQSEGEGKP